MSEWKEPTNAAEELLCAAPSLLTDHPWVRDAIVQLRAHAAALDRIAALEAENARLRQMDLLPAIAAYRAEAERDAAVRDAAELRMALIDAIHGKPCPTPAQWAQIQSLIGRKP